MNKLASALPAPKVELPVIGVAHKVVGSTEGEFGLNNSNLDL